MTGLLLWPAALAIGVILGLFGAGGGMVTVPALVYLAEIPVKEAIAMSLWIVAIVSCTALALQRPWRILQARLLLTFGVTGTTGSVIGALLATGIPAQFQMLLLATLILVVTIWLSRIKLEDRISIFRFIPATITGFTIGILTGILGVGGGFLLVPALIYLGIRQFPAAVAHSLVLITINATAGAITHLETSQIDVSLTFMFSLIAATGSVLGGSLLKRLPARRLQGMFSGLLIVIGGLMLWQGIKGL